MERKEHPVGEVLIIPMRSSTSLSPQDSARPLPLQPSSPPPPLSLSSPQLQAEFLRRAPRAASPDNDSARHQNLLHQPSPSVSSPPPPLSSPPPPLSLSSPQLQAEFLRRAPRAASPDNDSDRHKNLPHQPSPSVSPFSSPPPPLSSPPPPLSLSSPQLQAEFLRRAPRAASPDNDSDRHKNLPHQPSVSVSPFSSPPPPHSSPPPPLSLSSPQLQAEFLRRAPRAASPDNDSDRHKNLPHQPSPSVSPSVSLFSSPPTPLSSPPPPLSLSSPQLQAEFLRRASRGLRTVSCDTSDVLTSPSSTLVSLFTSPPQPLSSSMPTKEGCTTLLSLSSPELLTELCQSQSRPMKHVSVSKGLTTVFSGRGRGITNPSPATASGAANQTLRSDSMANRRGQAGPRLSNGTKR
ncbi:extensin isoform X2 [Oncorhynchus kisutch]|uniref:extensin isoform X2 n=1 Tax=Oncorhynchus kisutch TaxID=8019 RepID=UPI0012DD9348|nr:extensin isoform X2 [Oncorhynchus kisutch]